VTLKTVTIDGQTHVEVRDDKPVFVGDARRGRV
jgi:hypothetical protein